MAYIRLSDNSYPISELQIRMDNPNTSYTQPFNPGEAYAWVFPSPQPTFDSITQGVREVSPVVSTKGNWEQVWEVYSLDAEVIAANQAAYLETTKNTLEAAIEKMLDEKAKERTWKDCISARAAAGYPSAFQAEGVAFSVWWAACWEKAHQVMAEVLAGNRTLPTTEELLAEMPELVLPT